MTSATLESAVPASPIFEEPPEELVFEEAPVALSDDAFVSESRFAAVPPCPVPWRNPLRFVAWVTEIGFGLVSLFLFLSVLAALPLLNFLALGYLLEAEGRVARTGKLRYCLPLLPLASRLGSIAVGVALWLIPVRWVSDAAVDAAIIAPGSGIAGVWRIGAFLVSAVVSLHLILALSRGGGFGCFFRPLKNALWLRRQFREGDYWLTANAAVRDFFKALQIPSHFLLGLKGFAAAFIWLAIPTALFAVMQDPSQPGQVILTLVGGALLIPVLAWTPFLQARLASERRFVAGFELRAIREAFRRTPISFQLSIVLLYALSLPLYLFKVAALPRDAIWLETPIFIASIYPARILIGWAYGRAVRKTTRSWMLLQWTMRLLLAPLLAFYVFLLFFTPSIGAYGRRVLFEHHALLLPAPF